MKKNYLFILTACVIFSSCMTTNKGYQSSPMKSMKVSQNEIKAEIDVDESGKIKGDSKSTYFLFFRISGDSEYADGINYSTSTLGQNPLALLNPFKLLQAIFTGGAEEKVKASAAFNALDGTDADVIVNPTYLITRKNYILFYEYEVEVTGYAGTYKNFKNYDPIEDQLNRKIANRVKYNLDMEIK